MTLVRWYPTRDTVDLSEQMNRMLEDVFAPSTRPGPDRLGWSPHVDIAESKDGYVVVVEAPGMSKDDIKISLNKDILTLQGEKRRPDNVNGVKFHRSERAWGGFQRSFRLPDAVDSAKVGAVYKDGILRVTLPKAEKAKAKQIPVSVK
jgi:HSP20 family protein